MTVLVDNRIEVKKFGPLVRCKVWTRLPEICPSVTFWGFDELKTYVRARKWAAIEWPHLEV